MTAGAVQTAPRDQQADESSVHLGVAKTAGRVAVRIALSFGRRIALLITLLALVFLAVDMLPGDAARAALGVDATQEQVREKSQELGLDDPVPVRFFRWIGGLSTGDLGTTTLGAPISEVIGARLPNTVLLALLALIVTSLIAIVGGGVWMLRPHGIAARILAPGTMMLLALPEFVVAIILVLVFSLGLGLLPAVTTTNALNLSNWEVLVLPVLSLALPKGAWNIRVVRSAFIDAASSPHVEAAILDGYSKWHVLLRHILPVAMPTIAASIGTTTAMLFGGALVVEVVFNYPGIGALMAGSVANRDTTLAASIVAVSAICIMCVLFISDALKSWSTKGRA